MSTFLRPRFRWRLMLPVVNSVVYIILFWLEFHWTGHHVSDLSPPEFSFAGQEAAIGWDPHEIWWRAPAKLAFALNLPACLPGGLLVWLVSLFWPPVLFQTYIAVGLFVPPQWYYVGRWVDIRMGSFELKPRGPTPRWMQALAAIGVLTFGCLGILAMFGLLLLLIRVREADADMVGIALSATLWSFFLCIVLVDKLRR